jgi:hypothetical protein
MFVKPGAMSSSFNLSRQTSLALTGNVTQPLWERAHYGRWYHEMKDVSEQSIRKLPHNMRIWGTQKLTDCLEHSRDSPELNFFCALSSVNVYESFSFHEKTVTDITYVHTLQNFLMASLQENMGEHIIFQQNWVPPHCSRAVTAHLSYTPRPLFGWHVVGT